MKKVLVRSLSLLSLTLFIWASAFAQADANGKAVAAGAKEAPGVSAISATTAPADLARAALAAQGGEKFKSLKSMVLRGSVDLYGPNSTQGIPGGFVLVVAGDKMRLEVDGRPAISFKQIYDGQQSYSSLPGVEFPSESKFGISMLTRFDQPGYTVTALPDKKKQRGFRISSAEGVTDFYVDAATGRVMTFLIPFNGYTFGTEHKKFKDFEGVLVPVSFSRRIEMPQGAFFADFNVKDVKLNNPIGDDVFVIPN